MSLMSVDLIFHESGGFLCEFAGSVNNQSFDALISVMLTLKW